MNGELRKKWNQMEKIATKYSYMITKTGLRSYRCSSVTVTARTVGSNDGRQDSRRSPRSRGMDALCWRQELGCNVLISTSVLGNGISLHADTVDHLVLCQPGKTSFLQMLGRLLHTFWGIDSLNS